MQVAKNAATRRLFAAMLRQSVVVILAVALGGLLGGLYAMSGERVFTSQASVLVGPLQGNPYSPTGRGDELINLETEAQLVASDTVGRAVAERLSQPLASSERLLGGVSVTVPPNTQILQIKFASDSPRNARLGAEAFAESYLALRAERASAVLSGRTEQLDDQVEKIEERLAEASERQAATGTSATQRGLLAEQIAAYIAQLSEIEGRRSDLLVTDVDAGQVISPPGPGKSQGLRLPAFVAAGMLLGLLLGALVGFWRERRSDLIRSVDDLTDRGVPVLTEGVPRRQRPLQVDDPAGVVVGEFRRLRTALLSTAEEDPVALLISNVSPGGLAEDTARGLAIALASADLRVVLVDAAPGHPEVPVVRQGLPGLSEALLDGQPATRLLQATLHPQLHVLPAGRRSGIAAERYAGAGMRRVVAELKADNDFVIFASSPVTDADGGALIAAVDRVLLLVPLGTATWAHLHDSLREVERLNGDLFGFVTVSPVNERAWPLRQREVRAPHADDEPAMVEKVDDQTTVAR